MTDKITDKFLVQMKGSKNDPKFEDAMNISGGKISFTEYLEDKGINTLKEDLVISCHGNTPLTLKLSKSIQALADNEKLAVAASGGLYFALPSLVAANAPTVPIWIIPLEGSHFDGLDSFLAAMLPSGTAAIAGVGIGNYDTAAYMLSEILNNEYPGVQIFGEKDEKLVKKLGELNVPIVEKSGLVLGVLDVNEEKQFKEFDEIEDSIGLLTPISEKKAWRAVSLKDYLGEMNKSAYVRGPENLAFMAAKIMASYNPDIANALKDAAEKKADSYDNTRIITPAEFRNNGGK